jgi:uncharacterized protein YjbI with pentapeptide repeats
LGLLTLVVAPPDLPGLERVAVAVPGDDGGLTLDGMLVEHADSEPVVARRVLVIESELRGVVLRADSAPGLQLTDVVLRDCDLSNVDGREGSLRRVEIRGSRLVGLGLAAGTARDLRIVDSSLALASFAFAKLSDVVFDRVDLTEASFIEAQLERVEFVDCELSGVDFRAARTTACAIRGASLEGVLGVDSLNGIAMPWPDVLGSAGALAAALGIIVETE